MNMETIERDSVAIIGIASRFPGSDDNEAFWETLEKGQNHVSVIPDDRWKTESFHTDKDNTPGKAYTKKGAFLNR